MITELALECVEFTRGHCRHLRSIDYDVRQYHDDGTTREYFSRDDTAPASPGAPSAAMTRPGCGRCRAGRIAAHRPTAIPPGTPATLRRHVTDSVSHRPGRHGAPRLGAHAHPQPPRTGGPDRSPAEGV
ncbi:MULTISPECIES: hypothetical protein [unclassified Kitasatospora]|uniref:hypothetical protein n=1 Tax=unclassified Kitasatospora TaxID=2633591 RepID=UPI0033CBC748